MTSPDVRALRLGVSEAGRQILAAAVRIDHDWSLPASSEDKMFAAVEGLSDEDLEGARLLAQYLQEAVTCVQIQRATRLGAAAGGEEPAYPAVGSVIPGQSGYVVGECGHRVARSEWLAGFLTCERYPSSSAGGER